MLITRSQGESIAQNVSYFTCSSNLSIFCSEEVQNSSWIDYENASNDVCNFKRIERRFAEIVKGRLMQGFDTHVTLYRPGSSFTLGIDNSLIMAEYRPNYSRICKHPTLPLLFEYPKTMLDSTCGRFLIASEASIEDEAKMATTNCNRYGGSLGAKRIFVNKKRQPEFSESSEQSSDSDSDYLKQVLFVFSLSLNCS